MIQKKVCLLGAFSVGKTSLIRRFVSSLFDEKYLTTVGVKIDKKQMHTHSTDLMLMIWDLAGEDDFTEIKTSYLRGTAACIIVVDGTRAKTMDTGLRLAQFVQGLPNDISIVVALNKCDMEAEWKVDQAQLRAALPAHIPLLKTSALTGESVDALFDTVAELVLDIPPKAA